VAHVVVFLFPLMARKILGNKKKKIALDAVGLGKGLVGSIDKKMSFSQGISMALSVRQIRMVETKAGKKF